MQIMNIRGSKEENILAEIVLRTLTLKRYKDDGEDLTQNLKQQGIENDGQGSKGKKARGEEKSENEAAYQEKMEVETAFAEKAEEAGLTTPHLAP